jgi:hypothetical protein
MSRRLTQPVARRQSLPLTDQDEADLADLRESPALLDSLARLASSGSPIEATVSEALLLHSLLRVGLATVRADASADGYAQLSAEYAESAQERRALSRRRSPGWAERA